MHTTCENATNAMYNSSPHLNLRALGKDPLKLSNVISLISCHLLCFNDMESVYYLPIPVMMLLY